MRATTYAVALLVAVAGNLACGPAPSKTAHNSADSSASQTAHRNTASASEAALARSVNTFAFDLYRRLEKTPGNLTFSPLSVSAAMGLAYVGASGETRNQMQRVLHVPADDAQTFAGYQSLLAMVDLRAQATGARWTLANTIWVQAGMPLQPNFVRTIWGGFRSEAGGLDFRGAPDAARDTMNRWVERRTEGRIRELFPSGSIDASTRLVLANAVYFKGRWATAFDRRGTRAWPFHLDTGKDKPTPVMELVHGFGLARIKGARVLELPYEGEKISMLILLPDEGVDLRGFESRLYADSLAAWTAALRTQNVIVDLPRFTATSRFELSPTLASLGMPSAFEEGKADFSGIDGTRGLFISQVIHEAFAEVNEEGTEAAAATGVEMTIGVTPISEIFRADRPFLYVIRDRATGCILFMGRVADPTP